MSLPRLSGMFGLGLGIAAVLARPAAAQSLDLDGYADFRLVRTAGDQSADDGGLGKLRWGGAESQIAPEAPTLLLRGIAVLTPELLATAELRSGPQQKTALDLLDASLRWRPVSTTPFRWWVKAGAFFPPISLENDGIGWTSPWTLTPSALNSWIGDELRVFGAEADAEWRGESDRFSVTAGLYGWDDPAGVELADRGWSFNDNPVGLNDHLRMPDAIALAAHHTGPVYSADFREIDDSPGWYAGAQWDHPGLADLRLLRYDNAADDTEHRGQFAWATRFWSAGLSSDFGEFTVLAQALTGETAIHPLPGPASVTGMHAVYALLGWQRGDWRLAARIDQFGTRTQADDSAAPWGEHGKALTLSASWKPWDWLRLSAESLTVDSWRLQRAVIDLPPRAIDTQVQFDARLFF